VSVHSAEGAGKALKTIKIAKVFNAPVRADIVQFVHTQIRKNNRMPHGVSPKAGHQTSAESWGTGRAVARIPRVRGGGTHRSGQGAYGNMCRGGHMFGAKKTHRRFHRKCTLRQRRYAIVSAIAASGSPGIVMSKGHQINKTREIPLVVHDKLESFKKAKDAVNFLKRHNAWSDVKRVYASMRNRAGKGKLRNRRKVMRKGPLIIYNKNNGLSLAFRNIPGVETICVDRLNLLKLAPGGHVGRFCIWTEGAMQKLDQIYGTYHKKAELKDNFNLPQPIMTSSDLMGIFKNENIRNNLKAPKLNRVLSDIKLNPLKNDKQLFKLNPYAKVQKLNAAVQQQLNLQKKEQKKLDYQTKLRLAKRKANSKALVAAAVKKAGKERALKRLRKSAEAKKAFLEKKPRKHDKDAADKSKLSVKEKKALRKKLETKYKTAGKEFLEKNKKKGPKKTKEIALPNPKPVKLTAEQLAEKKKLFKARKAEKVRSQKKDAASLQASILAKIPEVVAARKQAAKEAKLVKAAATRKACGRIKKYKHITKDTPAFCKAKKYDGKKPKYASQAKTKNAKAKEQRAAEVAKLEKLAGMKFLVRQ